MGAILTKRNKTYETQLQKIYRASRFDREKCIELKHQELLNSQTFKNQYF